MIPLKEFLAIFNEDSRFTRQELERFYRSVKRVVILSFAGNKGYSLLTKIAMKDQWPILKKIDEQGLSIYDGADTNLLSAFIRTIKEQKKNDTWLTLRKTTLEIARLYPDIFDFSEKEIERCAKIGRNFEKLAIKKAHFLKLVGWGALGAAGVAGAVGAGIYIRKKQKK